MKVKMLTSLAGDRSGYTAGHVYDMDDRQAVRLVERGMAESQLKPAEYRKVVERVAAEDTARDKTASEQASIAEADAKRAKAKTLAEQAAVLNAEADLIDPRVKVDPPPGDGDGGKPDADTGAGTGDDASNT